ncbi:alkaline phosphatase PafA [Pontibacter amylolyticus]|uniref:Alkaline phosphatase family protein n=1 Tax=Pontibacter amylolyticus TaxID=1424080 RepID=A0ABQ1WDK7_9BACT|nr:alkaline phosphatase PafA [Pontibacter amylolyticus]GGG26109.1 alkaline phosphatase family protein [Pontibacter amylolyticus]
MVSRILYALSMSFLLGACASIKQPEPVSTLPRPKLVVGIVVDQMRYDYLYRYYDRYQDKGFKRLLNEGFSCENTIIDYVPTMTGVGHSTLYTGSVPAIHGITGNDFIVQETGKGMYCVEDSTVQTVGSPTRAGKMSPRNLLANTITDELKLATNFRSKVIGISLKDRGSILPAGHAGDAAYWFDGHTGNWITSTYYMHQLPKWVQQFNEQKLPEKYLRQDWHTLYELETYVQSSPDDNHYEGPFSGMKTPTFPVKTSGMYGKSFDILRTTPYGNTITVDLAKVAIEQEQLGQDEITDFLALSFSTPDYVGHKFGVNAVEIEDTYLRLDLDLANLFDYLDAKVGKGSYTVFLSSDHGAAHNQNFLLDHKLPAGFWPGGKLKNELDERLREKYKAGNLVLSFSNNQVHLNNKLIEERNLNEEAIRQDCVKFLRNKTGIAHVVDLSRIQETPLPVELQQRLQNGYYASRSGAIQIILKPGWFSGSGTGTTHGSLYGYDAHIPLLWMGWGIPQGSTTRRVNMSDVAATLAALLRVQQPNGSIGSPVTELFEK